jgi:signal transducing adaptor molecule
VYNSLVQQNYQFPSRSSKPDDYKPPTKDKDKEEEDYELALALSLSDVHIQKKKEVVRPRSPDPLFSVRALYDFAGGDEGELKLMRGDIVDVFDNTTFKDWWKGSKGGRIGIFPQNYVERVQDVGSGPVGVENAAPLVDKFLSLLGNVDPRRSISEQTELQETYARILELQPRLLEELTALEGERERVGKANERFQKACVVYQRMMEEAQAARGGLWGF